MSPPKARNLSKPSRCKLHYKVLFGFLLISLISLLTLINFTILAGDPAAQRQKFTKLEEEKTLLSPHNKLLRRTAMIQAPCESVPTTKKKESEYQIVHVVTTRFMLGQTNEPILGRARLELFETFCLPTMLHQINQNFVWLILTDPKLDSILLHDLRKLLEPLPNAYLLLTNEHNKWNENYYGVDLQLVADRYRAGKLKVLTGDTTYLVRFNLFKPHTWASQKILLIDTLLDADDGFHRWTIDEMQSSALSHSRHQQASTSKQFEHGDSSSESSKESLESTWWTFCVQNHLEWHNRNIFFKHQNASVHLGPGIIGKREPPGICSSAGSTRVGVMQLPIGSIGTFFPRVSLYPHNRLQDYDQCHGNANTGCFTRLFPNFFAVIRSRTITSDSMDHLSVDAMKNETNFGTGKKGSESPLQLFRKDDFIWDALLHDFGVVEKRALSTSKYLYDHMEEITKEHLSARCAPGYPCHEEATNSLQQLLNLTTVNKQQQQQQQQ
jgi:hypothetical protein